MVRGGVPAAKRFSCILEAPDGLSWNLFVAKFGVGHAPSAPPLNPPTPIFHRWLKTTFSQFRSTLLPLGPTPRTRTIVVPPEHSVLVVFVTFSGFFGFVHLAALANGHFLNACRYRLGLVYRITYTSTFLNQFAAPGFWTWRGSAPGRIHRVTVT